MAVRAGRFAAGRSPERLHLDSFLRDRVDYDGYHDFEWVSVERRDRKKDLEFDKEEGWAFHELSDVDASKGGANGAEVDALRLMAMFLHHWDNKAPNQRLVCTSPQWHRPPGGESADYPRCDRPLAMCRTSARRSVRGRSISRHGVERPMWADRSTCTVSMKTFPYGGGTFPDARISEAGRRLNWPIVCGN